MRIHFPMFWELYELLLHAEYVRNPNVLLFILSRTIGNRFPSVLGTILDVKTNKKNFFPIPF